MDIKYRAYKNNKIVGWEELQTIESWWKLGNLMAFTGLTDVKGVEIYEGDIVKSDDKYYPINSVIYYAEIVNEHDGDYDEWYCGFCLDDVDYTPLSDDVEVIGNIMENKELLNEKD